MIKNVLRNLLVLAILAAGVNLHAQNGLSFDKYKTNSEVQKALTLLQQKSPSAASLHKIADSPGGEPIYVLEIGKELKNVPAIFVGANFEGKTPLSTEGALYLAKMLLDSANYTRKVKVRLKNAKGLPTMSYKSISTRLYTQDMLKVTGAKVVASGKIADLRTNKISYQEHKPEIIYTSVPSYGFAEYQFLVEGKGEIKVNYSSRKAGNLVKTLKL